METTRKDGSASKLFMPFEKLVRSSQGMAIHGDRAFILYDSGLCGVYNLKTRDPAPVASFRLGSYNEGEPTPDYRNHANHCLFGTREREGSLPYLYVTIGSGIGADEDGYFYRMSVEKITEEGDSYRSEVLQTISYVPSEVPAPFVSPCWGCPAFFADEDEGALYIFSARYRTKRGCVPEGEQNAYIITRFDLPKLSDGSFVRLSGSDIRDQFSVKSNVLFTQGGQLTDGVIYYTFGCPGHEYPVRLMAFDLRQKKLLWEADNLSEAFRMKEIECCDWYQGQLLCNTNGGDLIAVHFTDGSL